MGKVVRKIFDGEFLRAWMPRTSQEGGMISEVSVWFQTRLSSVFWLEP